jgi:Ser-tRNA(Ala) deacylase AlaX
VCSRRVGLGRVQLVKIPDIDLQLCRGIHVDNIAQIGGIRVTRIRNEDKRNRRVEIVLAA